MAMPRHPTPGMPPFYGEHPPAYNPMMQPPQVEKPLGPMPPQMHVPQVRFEDFFFFFCETWKISNHNRTFV